MKFFFKKWLNYFDLSDTNTLIETGLDYFKEKIMRRNTPSTYTEVAVEVLAAAGSRELTAAQVFENARKRGMLRRFTAQGRTLDQVKVGLSAKLRQSAASGSSGIAARQKNGVNLYSL
jgi:hypothetical protein